LKTAAAIGYWLGWYLGKMSRQTDLELLDTRLGNCRNDRKGDKAQIKKLEQQTQDQIEQLTACETARKELAAAGADTNEFDELNAQLAEWRKKCTDSENQLRTLERRLQEHVQRLEACEAEKAQQAATARDTDDLDSLTVLLNDYKQRDEGSKTQIKNLEHQTLEQSKKLDACEAARAEQTAELERLHVQLRETRSSTAAAAHSAPLGLMDTGTGETSTADDDRPAALLSAPEGTPDDLKKIKGIGPRLESLLHGLGVYHFRQIAAFTPDDISWIDQRLSFKGRIEREKWVEQAKGFADQ